MSLPTRAFGRTGMHLTRVGFGAWAIGGGGYRWGWGDQDDDVSVATIRHAIELGLNWIDTAPVYGLGHSEEVVGRALRAMPESDRPFVFTKCGMVWGEDPQADPAIVGRPESVRAECEASLKRLGVDRVDLLQMHWPAGDGTSVEDYWGAMLELRQEGKTRAVGLCNHPVELLERAEAVGHVETMQPPFSAIKRAAGGDVIPWCAARGTGVISYSAMQAGLLTGAFSRQRAAALPASDWRSREPEYRGEELERSLALAGALTAIAADAGLSLAAFAVAWVAAWPGVTGGIAGARSPQQLDGWIAGASAALEPGILARAAASIEATGAGEGPARPAELS
jgi:aryl-alcohol dehydrogenase-like predicted oxidoreductase